MKSEGTSQDQYKLFPEGLLNFMLVQTDYCVFHQHRCASKAIEMEKEHEVAAQMHTGSEMEVSLFLSFF